MKIFLTGGTGFIGRHLCHKLVNEGHEVVALVRNADKISVLPQQNVHVVQGDLSSFKKTDFTIPQCDLVIHLAGTITAQKSKQYHEYNYQAVIDLYNCLKRQSFIPKRILFASSLAASGPSTKELNLTEEQPAKPIEIYGVSKKLAEDFLLKESEIPITIFRPPVVIGPLDTNLLNMYKIAKTGFGFVPSKKQLLSFISVSDLINAISSFTADKTTEHKTYFVAHDSPTTVSEMWLKVGESVNKKLRLIPLPNPFLYLTVLANSVTTKLFNADRVFDKKYYQQLQADAWVCSSEKLKKDFGWQATKGLDEAIRETSRSYFENGWL